MDADSVEPPPARQMECCNWGYARGTCERLPADGPDAVRFVVESEEAGRLTILYAIERDHRPAGVGREAFERNDLAMEDAPPSAGEPAVRSQSRAYAAAFVRALTGEDG